MIDTIQQKHVGDRRTKYGPVSQTPDQEGKLKKHV